MEDKRKLGPDQVPARASASLWSSRGGGTTEHAHATQLRGARASRTPPSAISCSVYGVPRVSRSAQEGRGSPRPAGEGDTAWPAAPLLALKIIYVCKLLLTHMSYSSGLPTGPGTGESCRAVS